MQVQIDFTKPIGQQFIAAANFLAVPDALRTQIFEVDIADLNTTDYTFSPNSQPNVQASDFTKTAARQAYDSLKAFVISFNTDISGKTLAQITTLNQAKEVLAACVLALGGFNNDKTFKNIQDWDAIKLLK